MFSDKVANAGVTGFTKQAQEIYHHLLCVDDPLANKLLKSLDATGAEQLLVLSLLLAEQPAFIKHVCIRTVFGATEELPFRAIAYILPALKLAGKIMEVCGGVGLPQLEFVSMGQAGIELNNLKSDRVVSQQKVLFSLIKRYVESFHPRLLPAIQLLNDHQFTPRLLRSPEFHIFLNEFKTDIKHYPELENILLEMGKNNGQPETAYTYSALHPLLHDGRVKAEYGALSKVNEEYGLVGEPVSSQPEIIISVGAQPERHFYDLRKVMRRIPSLEKLLHFLPTAQYMSALTTPPYLPLKEGDLSMQHVIENPTVLESVMYGKDRRQLSPYQTPVHKAGEMVAADIEKQLFLGSGLELINFFAEG